MVHATDHGHLQNWEDYRLWACKQAIQVGKAKGYLFILGQSPQNKCCAQISTPGSLLSNNS